MNMNKIMLGRLQKILLTLIAIIFIPFYIANGEVTYPNPTNLKYINDYVGIVDTNTKEYLISVGKELEDKTGAQAVVVVINSLQGNEIRNYGINLFRAWGIGQKGKNNGLLILVSIEDRQWAVEVGSGLEGTVPDILGNRIMESEAVPNFQNNNYSAGIKRAYTIFADVIGKEYGVTLNKNEKINYSINTETNNETRTPFPLFIILGMIFLDAIFNRARIMRFLLKMMFWSSVFGGRRGGRGGGGFGGGGFGGGGGGFGGFGGGSSGGGGTSGRW